MNRTTDPQKDDTVAADLTIVRIFNAPRALVWQVWTDPAHTMQWMGPRDYPAVVFEQDVQTGGRWRGCLRGVANADDELWQGGEYREVVAPERLVFTFAWDGGMETLVTVIFEELGDKTRMIFHQTPFASIEDRDGHNGGWNSAFDRLDDWLVAKS